MVLLGLFFGAFKVGPLSKIDIQKEVSSSLLPSLFSSFVAPVLFFSENFSPAFRCLMQFDFFFFFLTWQYTMFPLFLPLTAEHNSFGVWDCTGGNT